MKAISLWQPWATAIALGSKRVETRHWSTNYRGLLAIHAAKRYVKHEMQHYECEPFWRGALSGALGVHRLYSDLPFGAIVATCRLADVRPSEAFHPVEIDSLRHPDWQYRGRGLSWTERQMGNFGPGRFGWVLEDIQPVRWPIPFRGLQGLFNVPDELLAKERT
jgi:hypothetical protein